jgi:hypothetical protein
VQAKGEYDVMIEFPLPIEAEKMPVGGPDWDVTEGALEVKLNEFQPRPGSDEVIDGMMQHIVDNVSLVVRDAVINQGPSWPG